MLSNAKPKLRRSDAALVGVSVPRTKAEVLRGAMAGEPWAHEALYDVLYPVVARALQKILHQTSDYEDLVQTSFELIVRTLRKPRTQEIENLAAWSGAIAARVALDSLRVRIRERAIFDRDAEGDAEAVHAPQLERQLDVRSELVWLQSVLGLMRPEHAEAIVLHDVLGYDVVEVAKFTHSSVSAARKRLSRAHAALKKRAGRRFRAEAK